MSIGERIKKRRKELGMSVDLLAEKLNVDRSTIYRYESKEIGKFPIDIVVPLAKLLNVTPEYLMGWDGALEEELVIPSHFDDPEQARHYLQMHAIFGSNGFHLERLNDEEVVEFANELLKQMELVGFKYKK